MVCATSRVSTHGHYRALMASSNRTPARKEIDPAAGFKRAAIVLLLMVLGIITVIEVRPPQAYCTRFIAAEHTFIHTCTRYAAVQLICSQLLTRVNHPSGEHDPLLNPKLNPNLRVSD